MSMSIKLIGLDPSINNFGTAVLQEGQRGSALILQTFNLYDALMWLKEEIEASPLPVGVVLENPGIQRAIHHFAAGMSKNIAGSIGQRVGMSIAAATATIQCLNRLIEDGQPNLFFTEVNPSVRTACKGISVPSAAHYLPTKTNKAYFKALTGFMGQCNEHERDAATLIFGRKWGQIYVKKEIDSQKKLWGGKGKRRK